MPATSQLKRRVTRMIEVYCPEKLDDRDAILAKYDDWQVLLDAYVAKYGPEPAPKKKKRGNGSADGATDLTSDDGSARSPRQVAFAVPEDDGDEPNGNAAPSPARISAVPVEHLTPIASASREELVERIREMVKHYKNKDGDPAVEAQILQFQGRERNLLIGMIKKLGPEPRQLAIDAALASAPSHTAPVASATNAAPRPTSSAPPPSSSSPTHGPISPAAAKKGNVLHVEGRMRAPTMIPERPLGLLEEVPAELSKFKNDDVVMVRKVDKICKDAKGLRERVIVLTRYAVYLCEVKSTKVKRSIKLHDVRGIQTCSPTDPSGHHTQPMIIGIVAKDQPDMVLQLTMKSGNTDHTATPFVKALAKAVAFARRGENNRELSNLVRPVPTREQFFEHTSFFDGTPQGAESTLGEAKKKMDAAMAPEIEKDRALQMTAWDDDGSGGATADGGLLPNAANDAANESFGANAAPPAALSPAVAAAAASLARAQGRNVDGSLSPAAHSDHNAGGAPVIEVAPPLRADDSLVPEAVQRSPRDANFTPLDEDEIRDLRRRNQPALAEAEAQWAALPTPAHTPTSSRRPSDGAKRSQRQRVFSFRATPETQGLDDHSTRASRRNSPGVSRTVSQQHSRSHSPSAHYSSRDHHAHSHGVHGGSADAAELQRQLQQREEETAALRLQLEQAHAEVAGLRDGTTAVGGSHRRLRSREQRFEDKWRAKMNCHERRKEARRAERIARQTLIAEQQEAFGVFPSATRADLDLMETTKRFVGNIVAVEAQFRSELEVQESAAYEVLRVAEKERPSGDQEGSQAADSTKEGSVGIGVIDKKEGPEDETGARHLRIDQSLATMAAEQEAPALAAGIAGSGPSDQAAIDLPNDSGPPPPALSDQEVFSEAGAIDVDALIDGQSDATYSSVVSQCSPLSSDDEQVVRSRYLAAVSAAAGSPSSQQQYQSQRQTLGGYRDDDGDFGETVFSPPGVFADGSPSESEQRRLQQRQEQRIEATRAAPRSHGYCPQRGVFGRGRRDPLSLSPPRSIERNHSPHSGSGGGIVSDRPHAHSSTHTTTSMGGVQAPGRSDLPAASADMTEQNHNVGEVVANTTNAAGSGVRTSDGRHGKTSRFDEPPVDLGSTLTPESQAGPPGAPPKQRGLLDSTDSDDPYYGLDHEALEQIERGHRDLFPSPTPSEEAEAALEALLGDRPPPSASQLAYQHAVEGDSHGNQRHDMLHGGRDVANKTSEAIEAEAARQLALLLAGRAPGEWLQVEDDDSPFARLDDARLESAVPSRSVSHHHPQNLLHSSVGATDDPQRFLHASSRGVSAAASSQGPVNGRGGATPASHRGGSHSASVDRALDAVLGPRTGNQTGQYLPADGNHQHRRDGGGASRSVSQATRHVPSAAQSVAALDVQRSLSHAQSIPNMSIPPSGRHSPGVVVPQRRFMSTLPSSDGGKVGGEVNVEADAEGPRTGGMSAADAAALLSATFPDALTVGVDPSSASRNGDDQIERVQPPQSAFADTRLVPRIPDWPSASEAPLLAAALGKAPRTVEAAAPTMSDDEPITAQCGDVAAFARAARMIERCLPPPPDGAAVLVPESVTFDSSMNPGPGDRQGLSRDRHWNRGAAGQRTDEAESPAVFLRPVVLQSLRNMWRQRRSVKLGVKAVGGLQHATAWVSDSFVAYAEPTLVKADTTDAVVLGSVSASDDPPLFNGGGGGGSAYSAHTQSMRNSGLSSLVVGEGEGAASGPTRTFSTGSGPRAIGGGQKKGTATADGSLYRVTFADARHRTAVEHGLVTDTLRTYAVPASTWTAVLRGWHADTAA